ncbi:hypothetical protein L208DRAFT_1422566 [Tricholoma matsutake]|nr:hypothetical protein L208DRAFT_1424999 [Tricholoma matsutake 945]KAF8234858.1 hypothetical protein L208DRAFT_1422566 [Tricholoma matsutake 945]
MSISANSIPQENPHVQKSLLLPTYEFTKRKRWADLLLTEPADAITFVLSFSRVVLHCSLTVKELLGWKDVDLIDCDLIDLIATDDQVVFRSTFEESIRNKSELHSYVRLQCSGNRSSYSDTEDVLFEIRGHPHFIPECETEGSCFFAVAKPYPGRNIAMLDTYAELKAENERLQQRVLELQDRPSGRPLLSHVDPTTTSQLRPVSSQWNTETSSSFYSSSFNTHPTGFDSPPHSTTGILFDSSGHDGAPLHETPSTVTQNTDKDNETVLRKRKVKRSYVGEQYVCITCGRTDSPEWRKGPLGPKTLCNACGLRWAKQMRRIDDPAEGTGEAVTIT